MSFLQSDPASCGPSNAISNLNKHANTDRSFQQQLQFRDQQEESRLQGIRTQSQFNTDARLEQDFQQFANSGTANHFSNNSFAPQIQFSPQHQYQQQFPQHQAFQNQQQHQQPGWINDFQQMNISSQPDQVQRGGWTNEYSNVTSNMNPIMNQQQQQQQQQQQNLHQTQYQQPSSFSQSSYNAAYLQQQNRHFSQQQQQNTQFSQNTNMQQENKDVFETAFDDIESQLQDQQRAEEEQINEEPEYDQKNEEDKIKFAEIAKNVFNTMTNTPSNVSRETGNKFQNSNFLKLMNRISTREVEINDGGNKFIDSQGKDIRDMLPDPLRDIKESEFSQTFYTNNDEKDFVGPFKAAQIVHDKFETGDRMKPSQWDSSLDI